MPQQPEQRLNRWRPRPIPAITIYIVLLHNCSTSFLSFRHRSWSLPVVYILLTNKDIPIYLEAFQALVSNCPFLDPQTLMADFEQALRSALGTTFPRAVLDACFFHFCQAVLTNVNNLGYKTEYEAVTTDSTTGMVHHSTLYTWVRRLMMLAMVPTDNVPAVFNKIVEEIPDSLQLDPLLAYFERTWIQGMNGRPSRFPPAAWNQTDRVETNLNRTNNYCESFNNTFANVVGHSNPTIYNFLSAVQLEHAATEGKISCYRHNKPAPKRKNCYVEKDAEVKALVTTYHLYADNRVFEYLDLLAE